jgi:hypothetical protein
MHWLLQSNLGTDEKRKQYSDALEYIAQFGATWSYVKLIPFIGDVVPDDDYTGKKVFALGSTSMILAAQKRGWNPGVIFNENFRFEAWVNGFGAENLLNGDGVVSRFADAVIPDKKGFIRPCEDLKAFNGGPFDSENLKDWQKSIAAGEKSTRTLQLTSDTMVVTAPTKTIYREWRFFVVGGKVITGSLYRTAFQTCSDANVDDDVYEFAQKMADKWQPGECFVLDIGETKNGLSIIEVNCFNGSGLYACDMNKTFLAVEQLYGKK